MTTAKQLLELQAEYAAVKAAGETPPRTLDQIAAEYGTVLQQFIFEAALPPADSPDAVSYELNGVNA